MTRLHTLGLHFRSALKPTQEMAQMSYDGFYSDLSTRASANEILDTVLAAQTVVVAAEDNVEVLASQTESNADAAAASALAAQSAAGQTGDLADPVNPNHGAGQVARAVVNVASVKDLLSAK